MELYHYSSYMPSWCRPLVYVKHFTTVAFEQQDDLNFCIIKYSDGTCALKFDY
jgi:hypothetical protein